MQRGDGAKAVSPSIIFYEKKLSLPPVVQIQ